MYRLSVRLGLESGSCSTRKTHPATTNKLREGQRTIEIVSNRTARMPDTKLKPTLIPLRMSKGVRPRRAEKSTTKTPATNNALVQRLYERTNTPTPRKKIRRTKTVFIAFSRLQNPP